MGSTCITTACFVRLVRLLTVTLDLAFSEEGTEGTGWTFAPATVESMVDAVSTAVHIYHDQPHRWRAMQRRGMTTDYSWDSAAAQYEKVLMQVKAAATHYVKPG